MRLKNKFIIVTGASRGIGLAVASQCADEGATVALTYSSREDAGKAWVDSRKSDDRKHLNLKLQVQDEASVEAFFKEISQSWGKLDGLVNNAGITKDGLILRMKASDFDEVINVNLKGTFLCTKAAVKMMLKTGGSIVNMSSVVGLMGNPGQANYVSSKAGIEGLSRSVAQELASRQIRVNSVAPGFIQTDMTDQLTPAQSQQITEQIPLGTLGTAQDVAFATVFLLSDEARYITGQTLGVNGGLYMS